MRRASLVLVLLLASWSGTAFAQDNAPASERGTSFQQSGVNECRDTVPGGTLLAVAYALVLVALGGYVALLARKNGQLVTALEELEAELERRRPEEKDEAAT